MNSVTEYRGGVTHVYEGENTAEARRQAQIATTALADTGSASPQAKRIRSLRLLQESIARAAYQVPPVATVLPTIGAATAATAIVTGTAWDLPYLGTGQTKFTFTGGAWGPIGTTFPNNITWKGVVCHQGNGTDPTTNPSYGGRVRFMTEAPLLELWVQCSAATDGGGFRLKVDGQYVKAGTLGNDGNGLYRYIPITWGTGVAADRKLRHYELEFTTIGAFVGIRTAPIYKPSPWPQADGLRVLQHGDSLVATIIDSGTFSTGVAGHSGNCIPNMIGQSNYYASGTGGAGWVTPSAHTQSWFNDRVALDIVAAAPDVIIDHGGGNDEPQLTAGTVTQAAYQVLVETWLSAILTAKPETIIFMTGAINASSMAALGYTRIAAAKAAAAALWPKNVVFIDTAANPWVFGTGKQGTTTGDGNRDWVTGADGAHPTMEGHVALSSWLVRAVSASIPALLAAQG